MESLNPGYLGTFEEFRQRFSLAIERRRDPRQTETLQRLVRPLILRRLKTDPNVIQDLPDKMETKVFCNLRETLDTEVLYLHGRREGGGKAARQAMNPTTFGGGTSSLMGGGSRSLRRRFAAGRMLVAGSLLLSLAAFAPGCSPNWKNLTVEQRLEDSSYLFGVLKDNHPYLALKSRAEGYDWLVHQDEFEAMARASEDDRSFAQAISRMLAQVNNGHTNVASETSVRDMVDWNETPWKEAVRATTWARIDYWSNLAYVTAGSVPSAKQPPFLAVYKSGEYVVVAVAPDEETQQRVKPGMVVLEVDGRRVQDYVASQRGLPLSWQLRVRLDPTRRSLYQRELVLPASGDAFGDTLRVKLRDLQGQPVDAEVPYARTPWDSAYPWPPRYTGKAGSSAPNLYTDVLADGKVAYLQIADFLPNPEDPAALRRFFESVKDLPALIIDIRGNPGGNDTYWKRDVVGKLATGPVECTFYLAWRSGSYVQPFVQAKAALIPLLSEVSKTELVAMAGTGLEQNIPPEILTRDFANPLVYRYQVSPRDSVDYGGKIFLLVDDLSYSGAEAFAAFCKASGFATVVGTWTGGDGIALTPALVTLPNSGMVVRFPLVMGLNPDFTANEEAHTSPDVLVEQTFEDVVAYLSKHAGSGDLRPDPTCDAALRECLRLALEGAPK